jgi:hypothetical protein
MASIVLFLGFVDPHATWRVEKQPAMKSLLSCPALSQSLLAHIVKECQQCFPQFSYTSLTFFYNVRQTKQIVDLLSQCVTGIHCERRSTMFSCILVHLVEKCQWSIFLYDRDSYDRPLVFRFLFFFFYFIYTYMCVYVLNANPHLFFLFFSLYKQLRKKALLITCIHVGRLSQAVSWLHYTVVGTWICVCLRLLVLLTFAFWHDWC